MPAHVSEQIIAAIAAALAAPSATGAAKVFDSRVDPLQAADLTAIDVDEGDEVVVGGSTFGADRTVDRQLELAIRITAKKVSGYRTEVNARRKEVEVVIAANQSAGGAKWIQPRSTSLKLSGDADKPEAELTLNFVVAYTTALNAPDVPL